MQLARVLWQIVEPVFEDQPRWLFLDEPVSSLEIRHQLMIMGIAREFAMRGGVVVAVMYDLNLSALFADRICLMDRGRIAAFGKPAEVMCDHILSEIFECDLKVGVTPPPGARFVLPHTVAL